MFSDEGLSALSNFHFWESFIFYIYIIKTIVIVYCIKYGLRVDKKERPIFEEKERKRKLEKELKGKEKEKELKNEQIKTENSS